MKMKMTFYRGGAILLVYTTPDLMEKIKHQLEKLIEVEQANYYSGSDLYFELSNRSNKQGSVNSKLKL